MMGKRQRVLTTILWATAVVGMLGLVGTGLWAKKQSEARRDAVDDATLASGFPTLAIPQFSLIDQNGKPVTDDSLRGRVWIADFIFTNCAGPCPKMSAIMAELQDQIGHPDIRLVSFTVDPERDTPQKLKEYGKSFNADDSRWFFLTGSVDQMQDVAAGMKMAASKGENDQITHSTYFILIDREGQVRDVYGMTDPATPQRLTEDATRLASEKAGSRP